MQGNLSNSHLRSLLALHPEANPEKMCVCTHIYLLDYFPLFYCPVHTNIRICGVHGSLDHPVSISTVKKIPYKRVQRLTWSRQSFIASYVILNWVKLIFKPNIQIIGIEILYWFPWDLIGIKQIHFMYLVSFVYAACHAWSHFSYVLKATLNRY